jgi:CspA family cold shock protein
MTFMDSKSLKTNDETADFDTGIVKWYNQEKGYGFIEQANGRDLFMHYKEIRGTVQAGDRVKYRVGNGSKGPCACMVRVVKELMSRS